MEYKLCEDNTICYSFDYCKRCANLVYSSLTNEKESLKKTNKECLDKIEELEKTIDYMNEIHGELLDEHNELLDEHNELIYRFSELETEKAGLLEDIKRQRAVAALVEKLEKENRKLDEECERLHADNSWLTHECKDYIEKNSELVVENDKLRTMNSELIYMNGQLMKKSDHKLDELVKEKVRLLDDIKRLAEDRDRIHDELKELKSKKMVPLSEVYRIIAGHSNYHGNSILSALTCVAEGKEVGPVATYEYIWIKEKEFKELEKQLEWANENIESLNNKVFDDGFQIMSKNQKIMELEEEKSKLQQELYIANDRLHVERVSYDYLSSLYDDLQAGVSHEVYKELEEKCAKLEKENAKLDKECEKLHSDNSRLAHGCKDYIERNSELVKENDELRQNNKRWLESMEHFRGETDNLMSKCEALEFENSQLKKKSDHAIFQHAYGELNDKIEGLKEDIIRLDKCLSKRPCVKEERYGE